MTAAEFKKAERLYRKRAHLAAGERRFVVELMNHPGATLRPQDRDWLDVLAETCLPRRSARRTPPPPGPHRSMN